MLHRHIINVTFIILALILIQIITSYHVQALEKDHYYFETTTMNNKTSNSKQKLNNTTSQVINHNETENKDLTLEVIITISLSVVLICLIYFIILSMRLKNSLKNMTNKFKKQSVNENIQLSGNGHAPKQSQFAAHQGDVKEVRSQANSNKKFTGTILVAEDNKLNQNIIKIQLDQIGVESVIVNNGQEAWQMLNSNLTFDILLTDLYMPIINGHQLACKIRQNKALNSTTVILMTAESSEKITAQRKHSAFDDILFKPYNTDELHKVILPYLISEENLKPEWLKRFKDKESTEIANVFLSSMNRDIEILQSDTTESCKRKAIHSIKGAITAIGLTDLRDECITAESAQQADFEDKTLSLIRSLSIETDNVEKWIQDKCTKKVK